MRKVAVHQSWVPLSALAMLIGCGTAGGPFVPPAPEAPPVASPAPAQPSATVAGFERQLDWQGFSFRVSSPNDSSLGTVTIAVSGLASRVPSIVREVGGRVVGAAVGDLDSNGLPEVYVFGQSAGSGSYGSVTGLAVNADRATLADVAFPAVADDPTVATGYMGHDGFEVVGNRLVQRFPIYLPGDVNAEASGQTRRLEYALSWTGATASLRLERAVDE